MRCRTCPPPGTTVGRDSSASLATQEAEVLVTGIDDNGVEGGEVRVVIPPHAASTFTAKELAEGNEDFEGAFGDGTGKWRLFVENVHGQQFPYSDKEVRVMAMSLLESPTGHLTNLSTVPRNEYQGTHTIPFFPAKTAEARQGFARIVNRTEEAAEVSILAYDDDGQNTARSPFYSTPTKRPTSTPTTSRTGTPRKDSRAE